MNGASSNLFVGLSKATFDALGWPSLIAGCARRDCGSYHHRFRDKAKELEEAGQIDLGRAARALQWLTALQMRNDSTRQPFHGLRPMPGFQFPDPDDFGEPLLAIFAEMSRAADDPEFKARLADVCWSTQKKRDFTLVALAIEAYLASAENLCRAVAGEKDIDRCRRWDDATVRLERALRLATMTRHRRLDTVEAAFDGVLKNSLAEAPLLELGLLLSSYQDELEGDIAWLIQVASQCATRAETERQWVHQRHFLRLKANWQRRIGQIAPSVTTEEERAENYLREAEENPSSRGKAHWVAKAIKAYRGIAPKSPRIDTLKQLMDDYQRQGMAEMQTFTYPINKLFADEAAGGRRQKLLEILGADEVFELDGLLIRRYGANLRNSFAHGLFWPEQFYDSSVKYLWWVTLRLCVLHPFPRPSAKSASEQATGSAGVAP